MKLLLNVKEIEGVDPKEVMDFLSMELSMNLELDNGVIETVDNKEHLYLTQHDLFKLGMLFGKMQENAKWNEPEVLFLPNDLLELLSKAIESYSQDSYQSIDSIDVKYGEGVLGSLVVRPTKLRSLFYIFKRYGQLVDGDKTQGSYDMAIEYLKATLYNLRMSTGNKNVYGDTKEIAVSEIEEFLKGK